MQAGCQHHRDMRCSGGGAWRRGDARELPPSSLAVVVGGTLRLAARTGMTSFAGRAEALGPQRICCLAGFWLVGVAATTSEVLIFFFHPLSHLINTRDFSYTAWTCTTIGFILARTPLQRTTDALAATCLIASSLSKGR